MTLLFKYTRPWASSISVGVIRIPSAMRLVLLKLLCTKMLRLINFYNIIIGLGTTEAIFIARLGGDMNSTSKTVNSETSLPFSRNEKMSNSLKL